MLLSQVCFPMPLCESLNQTYETTVVTTPGLDQSLTPSKTLLQCMLFSPKAPQSHGPDTVESEWLWSFSCYYILDLDVSTWSQADLLALPSEKLKQPESKAFLAFSYCDSGSWPFQRNWTLHTFGLTMPTRLNPIHTLAYSLKICTHLFSFGSPILKVHLAL